jgi:signal transduction histidine kinase
MFNRGFIEYMEMIGEEIGLAVENSLSFEKIKEQKVELETAYGKLKKMQNELVESRKMAALGALIAGVAHEINTPVGISITGITTILKRNRTLNAAFKARTMKQKDLEDFIYFADESGQLVLRNLNRIGDLIKNFKRIATDKSLDIIKKIRLKHYLGEIVGSLRPRLTEKNIKTNIQCDDNLEITSYPGALAQVMINLIMNSIVHGFANFDGGKIKIIATLKDSGLELQYEDDGIGIEEKLLPKIFDPFVTSNKQFGSGLGLHIVYNLIKQTFKGTIRCESSVKQGVRFFISVPLSKGDIHG